MKRKTYNVNQFLSEEINNILLNADNGKRLLIEAPMKCGKTTAIKKIKEYYSKQYKGLKVVVIAPKKVLLEMISNDLNLQKVYGEYPYNTYRITQKDVITTPDSSYKVFNALNEAKKPYIVIYDEIHSMYLHNSFRTGLIVPKAYINSSTLVKYIGLSATCDFIPNSEFDDIALVRPTKQWRFANKIEVKKADNKKVVETLLNEIQKGLFDYSQIILRHNDKKVLNSLKTGLEKIGIECLVFSSDEFKDNEELTNYIHREKMDYPVILTTSTTDEGVELLTTTDKVLLLASYNENSVIHDIIQQFGRYRRGVEKCKILCFNFAKGVEFEEHYKEMEIIKRLYLKFSIESGKAFDTRFIKQNSNGEFEIKEESILEECIKLDIAHKVNDIGKLNAFLNSYYLTKDIEKETFSIKTEKIELMSEFEEISKQIKEEKKREEEQKAENEAKLNEYMLNAFKTLHEGHKRVFLTKPGELFIQDEWITDSFGEEYELFWSEDNKPKRAYYYKMLNEKGINELSYDEEIIDILFDNDRFKEYQLFVEIAPIREATSTQVKEMVDNLKMLKKTLKTNKSMAVIIRYVLSEKIEKQGRITKAEIEEITKMMIDYKIVTNNKVTKRKKEFNSKLNSLINNIISYKGNSNRISSIKKTF